MYLRVYIYIYEKKNRDKKNKDELAYVTRLWSKWKGNNDFNWKFYEKKRQTPYVDEINIKLLSCPMNTSI